MRINLHQQVYDSDFNPMRQGDAPAHAGGPGSQGEPLTLRDIIRRVLLAALPGEEKGLSEDEKFLRFNLALKVHEAKVGEDFSQSDLLTILKCAKLGYGTLFYGQIAAELKRAEKLEEEVRAGKANGHDDAERLADHLADLRKN